MHQAHVLNNSKAVMNLEAKVRKMRKIEGFFSTFPKQFLINFVN